MGKLINNRRAMKLALAVLIVVIVGFAAVLFFMSYGGRGEAAAESSVETTGSQAMKIDTSSDYAEELYGCKVDDVNDTAAVVKLLEAMGLENVTGKYTATIAAEGDIRVLTVTFEDSVQKANKKTLDDNMVICAQQMMALMPSVDKVQWTYSLRSADAEEETTTVSLDEAGAREQLSRNIDKYGESARAFRNLLQEQAGEE